MKNVLEINVNDEIRTFDVLLDAIQFIVRRIEKWIQEDNDKPFSLSIKRKDGRAPPLKISVSDGVGTRSGLV